jgi:hypothetical protein
MKNLFRVLIMFVVVPATYFFLYWLPFSLLPFTEHRWIPIIISLICAVGVGWYVWKKLGSMQYGMTSNVVMGALVIGGTGFSAGFFGPIILIPNANQGPLLGIFITGPAGLIIGAILGFVIGKIRDKSRSKETGRISNLILKIWTCMLWSCAILNVTVIAAVLIYVPWHESKYSSTIESPADLQKRNKKLTSLHVRSLSDTDLSQLQQFEHLNYLDFYFGWGLGEAKVTDAGLKNLPQLNLPRLESLMLGHCSRITDEGLRHVAAIKTLKYLSLASCPRITDGGLANLASSNSIETLDLRGCAGITNKGLVYLNQMKQLKEIMLDGCSNVSNDGIDALRRALPNTKIEKDDREWEMHAK